MFNWFICFNSISQAPNLEIVLHISFIEGKKTAGSAALRRCMAKFNNQDGRKGSEEEQWQFFTKTVTPLTSAEKSFQDQILDGSMSETNARAAFLKSEKMRVRACRKDFIRAFSCHQLPFPIRSSQKIRRREAAVQTSLVCHTAGSVGLLVQ